MEKNKCQQNVSFKLLQKLEITFSKTDEVAAKYGIKEVVEILKALEEPPQIKVILLSLPSIDAETFSDTIKNRILKATNVIEFRVDHFYSKAFGLFSDYIYNTYKIRKYEC